MYEKNMTLQCIGIHNNVFADVLDNIISLTLIKILAYQSRDCFNNTAKQRLCDKH